MRFILFFCLLILIGCSSQSKQDYSDHGQTQNGTPEEILAILWDYNANIPDYPNPYSTARKATLPFDEKIFQFNYEEVWDESTNVSEEQAKIEATRLSILENQLKNDPDGSNHGFLEILSKEGYGLRMQYVGKYRNLEKRDTIQIEISPEEIKNILNRYN